MWLILVIKAYLGWAVSICRRLVRLAAPQIGVVVAATIVSQVARLLAFFLPLKIIILIGSERVPRYFPRAFLDYEREPLVIWLGIATVCFYITYLIAEKVVEVFTERSAERVLAHTAKLALFENQDEIVGNACRRLAESIAAVIFAGLAIALLAYIYPLVAAVIVGWILAALLVVALAGMASEVFRAWLEEQAGDLIEAISALGFFAVTTVIVAQFIGGARFPILFAIIAVLLTRQLLQRVGKIFKNALSLYPGRFLVNTLFLRSHFWSANGRPERRRVWDLVTTKPPREWLPQLLAETTGETVADAEMTRWHEMGIVDVLTFEAKAEGGREAGYLIKLFGRKRQVAAAHEATLLGSLATGALPAPVFLGSARAGDHNCHIFEKPAGNPPSRAEFREFKLDLISECWQCHLPADLVRRYRCSHQLLGRRLAGIEFGRLGLAVWHPEEEAALARFKGALAEMCTALDEMPLVILNPDLKPESLARLDDSRLAALHWGRWRLEPVGAGWPIDSPELEQLPYWLDKAKEARKDLARVHPEDAQLAALLFEVDGFIGRQRYRSVIELLPDILKRAESFAGRRLFSVAPLKP